MGEQKERSESTFSGAAEGHDLRVEMEEWKAAAEVYEGLYAESCAKNRRLTKDLEEFRKISKDMEKWKRISELSEKYKKVRDYIDAIESINVSDIYAGSLDENMLASLQNIFGKKNPRVLWR